MMKLPYPIMIVLMTLLIIMLSGCSATSALSGLVGSKPEVTAQAGAENVKQAVGVTAKKDDSAEFKNEITDSKLDKFDSSSRQQNKVSSIKAETINAETVSISNRESDMYVVFFVIACFFIAGFASGVLWQGRNKKGA